MTQYNSLNVKLSNSQLNKLKSAIKNETDVILRLSSNMIGNSYDETNFPHKLMLTNRQVFAKPLLTTHELNKLSKTQLTKMQKGGFLKFLAPLLKSGLPLLKAAAKPLGLLGLTAVSSLTDALIHKKVGSAANNTTLIISNDELNDILKTVKSFEDSGILLKGVDKTIKKKQRNKRVVLYQCFWAL